MLAAQAEVQRVAPAMHDQMETEEMKKRADSGPDRILPRSMGYYHEVQGLAEV